MVLKFLILMLFGFPVCAEIPVAQGASEVSDDSSLDFRGNGEINIDIPATYGWAIREELSVKCSFRIVSVYDFRSGSYDYRLQQGDWITEFRLNDSATTSPYLGVEVGWRRTQFGSVKESGIILGSRAGVRFFFNDSVSIDTSIGFKFSTDEVFFVDDQATDQYIYPGIVLKAWF